MKVMLENVLVQNRIRMWLAVFFFLLTIFLTPIARVVHQGTSGHCVICAEVKIKDTISFIETLFSFLFLPNLKSSLIIVSFYIKIPLWNYSKINNSGEFCNKLQITILNSFLFLVNWATAIWRTWWGGHTRGSGGSGRSGWSGIASRSPLSYISGGPLRSGVTLRSGIWNILSLGWNETQMSCWACYVQY